VCCGPGAAWRIIGKMNAKPAKPFPGPQPLPRRRAQRGCLAPVCFALLLAVVVLLGLQGLLNPWIYVVGGRTRLLPFWAGRGDLQTAAGTYRIYIWFSPTTRGGSRMYPSTRVSGSGYVCSPRGEGYSLSVSGGTPGLVWKDMDGRKFSFSARHAPMWRSFTGAPRQPSLSFAGQWVGPNLAMTDNGSIAHAFLPNGSLDTRAKEGWYPKTAGVPITFRETTWWWGKPDCPARAH
jgi:hypothetical protein